MPDLPDLSDLSEVTESIVWHLRQRGEVLACAESLTGGLLVGALVDVPGTSVVLAGGVVAYSAAAKQKTLGVAKQLIARHGTVDPKVAVQMARGAQEQLGADWGLATTGVAGPGPFEGKPQGLVYLGISGPGVQRAVELRLTGGRVAVRAESVAAALHLLDDELRRADPK